MIIIEMMLLWCSLLFTICMVGAIISGHELVAPVTILAITFSTMYITLIRYSPVIKDSVVFG